ncbi:hypothetical protein NL676_022256 [Syzygium grande]|nr:hypothetical protein NL676_022256 [Syzygium grande]
MRLAFSVMNDGANHDVTEELATTTLLHLRSQITNKMQSLTGKDHVDFLVEGDEAEYAENRGIQVLDPHRRRPKGVPNTRIKGAAEKRKRKASSFIGGTSHKNNLLLGVNSGIAVSTVMEYADNIVKDLIGDLLDGPIYVPTNASSFNENSSEVDLFADASFVSVPPSVESSEKKFLHQLTYLLRQLQLLNLKPSPYKLFPLTPMEVSPRAQYICAPMAHCNLCLLLWLGSVYKITNVAMFCLLIKLAAKKVSLADVGVVGGLSDGSDERERGPPTSFYMGRAVGTGTGLGMSGFTSSQATGGDDFSSFARQSQYGSFKK